MRILTRKRLIVRPLRRFDLMPGYRGLGQASFFSDTLQVADTFGNALPNNLRSDQWIYASRAQPNSSSGITDQSGYQIVNSVLDGQKCLQWTPSGPTGSPGGGPSAFLIPLKVLALTFGAKHFIQATLVSTSDIVANGAIAGGLGVGMMLAAMGFASAGAVIDFLGYRFVISADDHSYQLTRGNGPAGGFSVLASGGAGTTANGDTFRLSFDPVSVPGQVGITLLRNGSVFQNVQDTNALRVTLGNPVLYSAGAIVGSSTQAVSEWRNMSCGIGL